MLYSIAYWCPTIRKWYIEKIFGLENAIKRKQELLLKYKDVRIVELVHK